MEIKNVPALVETLVDLPTTHFFDPVSVGIKKTIDDTRYLYLNGYAIEEFIDRRHISIDSEVRNYPERIIIDSDPDTLPYLSEVKRQILRNKRIYAKFPFGRFAYRKLSPYEKVTRSPQITTTTCIKTMSQSMLARSFSPLLEIERADFSLEVSGNVYLSQNGASLLHPIFRKMSYRSVNDPMPYPILRFNVNNTSEDYTQLSLFTETFLTWMYPRYDLDEIPNEQDMVNADINFKNLISFIRWLLARNPGSQVKRVGRGDRLWYQEERIQSFFNPIYDGEIF
jgi:hypothetical protein